MATKAELETELALLKSEMAKRPDAETSTAPDTEAAKSKTVKTTLAEYGIDAESLEELGSNLSKELLELQKEKPLVVLVTAFAFGCLMGRAFK